MNTKFKLGDSIFYLRKDELCVKLRFSKIYAMRFEATGVYYLVTVEFGKVHESNCFETEQEAIDAAAAMKSLPTKTPARRSFMQRLFNN